MPPEPGQDNRDNKDWLQIWFQLDQSNLQWAKGQGWNAVQWSILLVAALFAASTRYTRIRPGIWVTGAIVIAIISTWWQIDLHKFAKGARESSERILAGVKERGEYLPERRKDPHHVGLLIVRVGVVWAGIILTIFQLLDTNCPKSAP